MTIWALLSVSLCTFLCVKLALFSDAHRQASRWYWRVVLFLVTVYSAREVIQFFYTPWEPVSIWTVLFHGVLLAGAFIIRPEYLPWNQPHDTASQAHRIDRGTPHRLR